MTLTAGNKEGNAPATFGIFGAANGTKIAASYQAPDMAQALTGKAMLLEATLENPETRLLLGQTGFDPLPFDADANGILSVKLQSTDGSKANGTVTFTTEKSSLAAKGNVDLSRDHFLEGQAKITLETQDIEPYLLQQGVALPQMGSGLPLTISADVAASPEAIALTAVEGKADNNGFTGTLTVDRKAPGAATGQLTVDTLDLAWLGEGSSARSRMRTAHSRRAPWRSRPGRVSTSRSTCRRENSGRASMVRSPALPARWNGRATRFP